jgi:hypothetical protein
MELILKRIAKRKSYTIGKLFLVVDKLTSEQVDKSDEEGNNSSTKQLVNSSTEEYFCDTLEPTWRDYAHGAYKMKGCSAIPEGRYPLVVTWSPKFEQWLPLLLNVPKFSGIRIHAGNTPADTEGCILVGENRLKGQVLDSRRTLSLLKRRLAQRPEGEAVWITIIDE